MVVNSEYRNMINMVKDVDEQMKGVVELYSDEISSSYGMRFDIIHALHDFTDGQIKNFTRPILFNLYKEYRDENSSFVYPEGLEERETALRENLLKIHEIGQRSVYSLFDDRQKLMEEIKQVTTDYTAYLSSEEYKQKKISEREEMREKVANCEDEKERKILEKGLRNLEKSYDLSFIRERLDLLGEEEIERIVDAFFNPRKGAYVSERFKEKVSKLGINKEIHTALKSIEENFFDEDFHMFNNLFLFIVMRYIAHIDVYDKSEQVFTQSILLNLLKLCNHKFKEDDNEKSNLLDLIYYVDSKFFAYTEIFKEKNITAPNSEFRINAFRERNKEALKNLNEWFERHKVEAPVLPEEITNDMEDINNQKKAISILTEKMLTEEKRLDVIHWLKIFDVNYDENMSLTELEELRKSTITPPVEETELTEENDSNEVTADTHEEVSDTENDEKEISNTNESSDEKNEIVVEDDLFFSDSDDKITTDESVEVVDDDVIIEEETEGLSSPVVLDHLETYSKSSDLTKPIIFEAVPEDEEVIFEKDEESSDDYIIPVRKHTEE